jgi:quercetin dioxygenase-like cupin family protein
MSLTVRLPITVGLLGLFVLIPRAQTQRDVAGTANHKPVFITRVYTGPDGQTHTEETQAAFTEGGVLKLMEVTGAELHRMSPSASADWHLGPRRQYVITLSGTGEMEIAGGQKIPVGPGHISLIEDTTGKGHITRNFEDRVTLELPLAAQAGR